MFHPRYLDPVTSGNINPAYLVIFSRMSNVDTMLSQHYLENNPAQRTLSMSLVYGFGG